jgi:hypothetical protein
VRGPLGVPHRGGFSAWTVELGRTSDAARPDRRRTTGEHPFRRGTAHGSANRPGRLPVIGGDEPINAIHWRWSSSDQFCEG